MPKIEQVGSSTGGWFSKILLVAILAGIVFFVIEVLTIFRITGHEPVALIAGVFGLVVGEFGLIYAIHRNKQDIVKESIRYERDYESIPLAVEEPEAYGGDSGMGEGFEEVFK